VAETLHVSEADTSSTACKPRCQHIRVVLMRYGDKLTFVGDTQAGRRELGNTSQPSQELSASCSVVLVWFCRNGPGPCSKINTPFSSKLNLLYCYHGRRKPAAAGSADRRQAKPQPVAGAHLHGKHFICEMDSQVHGAVTELQALLPKHRPVDQ